MFAFLNLQCLQTNKPPPPPGEPPPSTAATSSATNNSTDATSKTTAEIPPPPPGAPPAYQASNAPRNPQTSTQPPPPPSGVPPPASLSNATANAQPASVQSYQHSMYQNQQQLFVVPPKSILLIPFSYFFTRPNICVLFCFSSRTRCVAA